MAEEILRIEHVTSLVDGRMVLDNINMHMFKGEIMGLVGINFQGQQELIDLICHNPSLRYGRVYYNERLVNSYERRRSQDNRVLVMEKRSQLVGDLTVADNIFVLRKGFRQFIIRRKMLEGQLKQFTEAVGIVIDANEFVDRLDSFEKKLIELLKAVVTGTKLVIIDNISTVVSDANLRVFQQLIRHYAEEGMSFLYICSHHEEAFRVCDRISIMENGQILKVLERRDFTREKMQPYYIQYTKKEEKHNQSRYHREMLKLQDVYAGNIQGLTLHALEGECTVIQDISNTIIDDLIEVMSGQQELEKGAIYIGNTWFTSSCAEKYLKNGVCFINRSPTQSMVFREMSYLDNLCFLLEEKLAGKQLTQKIRKSVAKEYETMIGADIYAKDLGALRDTSLYSLVYYRVHLFRPKIVFIVQPFADADLYVRMHILHLIRQLKKQGITVVILAVNLADSLMVADRLIIVEHGVFREDYTRAEFHQLDDEATIL